MIPVPVGSRLGPYLVEREIGSGGMGTVYRARVDRRVRGMEPGTRVALKVIHPALFTSPGIAQRFLREAEIGSRIRSPHLVATLDAGTAAVSEREVPYLAMELIEGESLQKILAAVGRFPDELCRRLGASIADGLAALHEHGVVHRDLKLENVLVTPDDRVLVTDFGTSRVQEELVRITRSGQFIGTLLYAAPEQFQSDGRDVDRAADLYALGWVLTCLVTGNHPLAELDMAAVTHSQLAVIPRPLHETGPGVSLLLSEVVATLLAKDPAARFASAAEVAATLRAGEASPWWEAHAARALEAAAAASCPVKPGSEGGGLPAPLLVPGDLDVQERDLLGLAACLGPRFDPSLAGAAYGLGVFDSLRRYKAMEEKYGIVRASGDEYRFAEPALRDRVLQSIPSALRSDLHAALERARAPRSFPAVPTSATTAALPPAADPSPFTTDGPMHETKAPGAARILVVDDEPMARGLLVEEARMLGHEIHACENGMAALVRLRREPFDLLITDVDMPGLNGVALLHRVKSDPRLKDIPVIVVSGGGGDIPVQCIRDGAEDFLQKPYDFVLLQARIGSCLQRRRLLQQEEAYRGELERHTLTLEEVLADARQREGALRREIEVLGELVKRLPAGAGPAVRKDLEERILGLQRIVGDGQGGAGPA